MNIAVLIQMHKNPAQLKRLINRLSHPNIDFFIHIDKKTTIGKSDLDSLKSLNDGRVFVIPDEDRYSVYLFHKTQVFAPLILMKYALVSKREYKYYLSLSGQCYPLRNADYIYSFLLNNYPKSFIDIDCLKNNNGEYTWVKSTFSIYHCLRKPYVVFRQWINSTKESLSKRIKKIILHAPIRIVSELATKVVGSPLEQLIKYGYKPYGGSDWWMLPDDMVKYIVEKSKDKKFNKILFHVDSPSETYFHTILMNSKFANRLDLDKHGKHQNTMTYADFRDENGNPFGHPRILKASDFDRLMKMDNYLFARKFDAEIDSSILDKIDFAADKKVRI